MKLKPNSYTLLLLVFFGLTHKTIAQNTNKKVVDGIAAVVGEKVVLKSDVETEFIQAINQLKTEPTTELKCHVLEKLVMNKFLLTQAELDSIKITDEEVNAQLDRRIKYFTQMMGGVDKLETFYGKSILEVKEEFRSPIREQILSQRMEDKLTSNLKITPSEVKEYFKKVPTDSIPFFDTEVEVGQIVIFPKVNDDAMAYAIDKLTEIRKRILKGENFATMAVLYSEDQGSAKMGGDLGFFGRGEMVNEFESSAFKMKPGEVSNIIKTKYGYHILQLIERRGDRANARHILIKPPVGTKDFVKSRTILDSVRGLIEDEKINFQKAVKDFSEDDETKSSAGLFLNPNSGSSFFTVDQLPSEIWFNVEKLSVGQVSNVIQYHAADGSTGFRIFYLKSRTSPHKASLETDYGKIQSAALSVKRAQIVDNWFEKAKERMFIKVSSEYEHCSMATKLKKND